MAHYSFIDSLMYGELYNYTKGPVYYLLELSGLPFGMMNDLYGWGAPNLGGEPNIHYGALCKDQRDLLCRLLLRLTTRLLSDGANARLPNGPGAPVITSVWQFWDVSSAPPSSAPVRTTSL